MKRFQENEVWASGRFRVDSCGRVWRGSKRAEHKLPSGYLQVRVMVNRAMYYTCAHRLVWRALSGPIPRGMVINHRNAIKDDNHPSNLQCSTPSANLKHAHANRLIDQRGQKNPHAKLSDRAVSQIRLAYASGRFTQVELGDRYGVAYQTISKIVRGSARQVQGGPIGDYSSRRSSSIRRRQFPEVRG
jgi:hypothetical protein